MIPVTFVLLLSNAKECATSTLKEWGSNNQICSVSNQPTTCQAGCLHTSLDSLNLNPVQSDHDGNLVHEFSSEVR